MKKRYFIALSVVFVMLSSNSCSKENESNSDNRKSIVEVSSDVPCVDSSRIKPTAPCTMDWIPVCGCDGKTYGNECAATNAGITSFTEGECK